MTIQSFIEKAISGGWNGREAIEAEEGHWRHKLALLDPEAWKALERNAILTADGWEKFTPQKIEQIAANEARMKMHRMIDALAEGKTISEFLETL